MLIVDLDGCYLRALDHRIGTDRYAQDLYQTTLDSLFRLSSDLNDDELVITMNIPFQRTWHMDHWNGYWPKWTSAPKRLLDAHKGLVSVLRDSGLPVIQHEGCEGDDLAATLAMHYIGESKNVTVVSCDYGLIPLIDHSIKIIRPLTLYQGTHESVKEQWGVAPSMVMDLIVLAGDGRGWSGLPKIGRARAAKLLELYGSLDNMLSCDCFPEVIERIPAIAARTPDNLRSIRRALTSHVSCFDNSNR